jgi:hypothetical protein
MTRSPSCQRVAASCEFAGVPDVGFDRSRFARFCRTSIDIQPEPFCNWTTTGGPAI